MKTRSTWLLALGMVGMYLIVDPVASGAGHDDPSPPVAAKEPVVLFRAPIDAVAAFLKAVKAKDAVQLRDATSVRFVTEAIPKNRPLFTAILEQKLSEAELTRLASQLDGFQVSGVTGHSPSGKTRFIVTKPGANGTQFVRTFAVRWQRQSGWKVSDIGEQEQRDLVKPLPGLSP